MDLFSFDYDAIIEKRSYIPIQRIVVLFQQFHLIFPENLDEQKIDFKNVDYNSLLHTSDVKKNNSK